MDSGVTFLEIKTKNNHGRTKKKRIRIPLENFENFSAAEGASDFLAEKSWFTAEQLSPRLRTTFRRITLVNNEKTERLTIDRGLHFHNYFSGKDADLEGAVIIELKQDGLCYSPMREILSQLRIKPLRVSKYCIGTALTDPVARKSRFIEKILKITTLGWLNRLLGAILGAAKIILLLSVIVYAFNRINTNWNLVSNATLKESSIWVWLVDLYEKLFPYLLSIKF